jgi:hypothetical protein
MASAWMRTIALLVVVGKSAWKHVHHNFVFEVNFKNVKFCSGIYMDCMGILNAWRCDNKAISYRDYTTIQFLT